MFTNNNVVKHILVWCSCSINNLIRILCSMSMVPVYNYCPVWGCFVDYFPIWVWKIVRDWTDNLWSGFSIRFILYLRLHKWPQNSNLSFLLVTRDAPSSPLKDPLWTHIQFTLETISWEIWVSKYRWIRGVIVNLLIVLLCFTHLRVPFRIYTCSVIPFLNAQNGAPLHLVFFASLPVEITKLYFIKSVMK